MAFSQRVAFSYGVYSLMDPLCLWQCFFCIVSILFFINNVCLLVYRNENDRYGEKRRENPKKGKGEPTSHLDEIKKHYNVICHKEEEKRKSLYRTCHVHFSN